MLVEILKESIYCDSHLVARKFGKKHAYVVRNIQSVIEDLEKLRVTTDHPKIMTEEREYRGQKYIAYLMDRNFFILLVMRFKGKSAIVWQLKFIDSFNKMEKALLQQSLNQNSLEWKHVRTQGIEMRKHETDIIKKFVSYATNQGSKSAKWYYKHITNATYKCLNLMQYKNPKLRDTLDFMELSQLVVAENIASNNLIKYMDIGEHYKVIFELVKQDLLKYADIVLLNNVDKV